MGSRNGKSPQRGVSVPVCLLVVIEIPPQRAVHPTRHPLPILLGPMSSDGFDSFEIDLDSGYLEGVDQIAATHFSSTASSATPVVPSPPNRLTASNSEQPPSSRINPQAPKFCPAKPPINAKSYSQIRNNPSSSTSASEWRSAPSSGPSTRPYISSTEVINIDDDSDEFGEFDDNLDFAQLDATESQFKSNPGAFRAPVATIQTTLDGLIAEMPEAGPSRAPPNIFGKQAAKVKTWDRTAFAETGFRANPGKGKKKQGWAEGDDEEDEEMVEFEQFPKPFISRTLSHPLMLKKYSNFSFE
ncbi:3'-5' DNA helicase [Tulasnella sp. JGI-2019a]|nr:3'-5' DNA helicase [Tulasnella sp. JGI-2019a]